MSGDQRVEELKAIEADTERYCRLILEGRERLAKLINQLADGSKLETILELLIKTRDKQLDMVKQVLTKNW